MSDITVADIICEHLQEHGQEIVEAWLREHGYDGLCTGACGCRLGDLMPCTTDYAFEMPDECVPGYAIGEVVTEDGKPVEGEQGALP